MSVKAAVRFLFSFPLVSSSLFQAHKHAHILSLRAVIPRAAGMKNGLDMRGIRKQRAENDAARSDRPCGKKQQSHHIRGRYQTNLG